MTEIKEGYLRVTAMLSPFSGLQNVPEYVLENAKERGIAVHQTILAIESGIGGDEPNEAIRGYISSYQQWANGKAFLECPNRFYDDSLMLTGEIDAIYKDGDDFIIVDYKTPVRESKTWAMQATAYSYLAKQSGYNVKRVEFVKLDKTGKEPKVFCYEEDMEMFHKILDTYRYFFGNKGQEIDLDY